MRRLLLLSVVVLSLPGVGCQLLLTGPRNVVFEICDRTGNLAEKCRDRKMARQAWEKERATDPGHKFSPDYVAGFEDGFVDFLEAGETAEPLPRLPDRYQKVKYQTPEGVRAIEDWVNGFRHGASVADEGGYRELVILPRSLFVVDPTHPP